MENKHLKLFLEDMSFATDYEFLEEGKHDDELKEIASKRGLTLPSKDLAIFKGRYAFTNRKNKNGCTLPHKEVSKSLKTLVGKAVDKDHLRKNTIGFWLDSDLEADEIISYGAFWKSNFPEDYEEIKKRMKEGSLKISFEAWGDRIMKEDGKSYDLNNIEFAGGALLFDTKPAFDGAEVLDFASINNRVLEFAKIMEEDIKEHKGEKDKKEMEKSTILNEARLSLMDLDYMQKVIWEIEECPSCHSKFPGLQLNSIDFENSIIRVQHNLCGAKLRIDLEPNIDIEKQGKKIKLIKAESSSTEEDLKKAELLKKEKEEGIRIMDELLKKYTKATVEELATFLDKELEITKASVKTVEEDFLKVIEESAESLKMCMNTKMKDGMKSKDAFKECIKMMKSSLDEEIATLKAKITEFEAEKAKVEKEKRDVLIKSRRDELTEEYAKDLKDEDIVDDVKFELAKAKKEIAKLKAEKPASAGLEAGAETKDKDNPSFTKQTNIQKKAFGE